MLPVTAPGRRAAAAALAAAALALPAAAQSYTITELEPFPNPDTQSRAYGIDEHGWVSGHANREITRYPHAVVWAGNVRLDLTGSGISGASARAIRSGVAVGISDTLGLNAFVWGAGELTPLPTDQACCSGAEDLAANGWIVGTVQFGPQSIPRAALWRDGLLTDLGTLGGLTSYAYAVNGAGQVVGGAFDADEGLRPFLWQDDAMVDLGSFGGAFGEAKDVNGAGQVVGYSNDAQGWPQAFLWEQGQMKALANLPGGLQSDAEAIDDLGRVVGAARDASGKMRATLWEAGVPIDLNDEIPPGTGWELTQAADINRHGEIVGNGRLGFELRGFKLTPVGLERLVLAPPVPGEAGVPNDITATWPVPGDAVEIWMSLAPFAPEAGAWTVGGGPPGRAVLLGTAIAGPDGSATLTVTPPAALAGRLVHLRAVRAGGGPVSGPVRHVLQ